MNMVLDSIFRKIPLEIHWKRDEQQDMQGYYGNTGTYGHVDSDHFYTILELCSITALYRAIPLEY